MALSQTSVLKLYNTVIDDVIAGVRDAFLDEGVDEQVLQEMKQVWTSKLMASKAVETTPDSSDQQPPPLLSNSAKSVSHSKANGAKSKANRNAVVAAAAAAAASAASVAKQNEGRMNGNSNKTTPATTTAAVSNLSNAQNNQMNNEIAQQPQQQQTQQVQPQQQAQPQPSQQQSSGPPATVVAALDPNKLVAIQITLPPQPNVPNSESRVLTIQVPASALQENQLQQVLTGPIISSIMPLPPAIASSVLQQHVNSYLQNHSINTMQIQNQLDGTVDTSDEEGSDISDDNIDGDDDDDLDKEDEEDIDGDGGAEEEPLNSEDDVTDEDASDLFDTDNVVVCQYDKITRSRNKWKFYLKDGIMNIGGKDYVFQKSNGDAEW